MNSRWRYNWIPFADEGIGAGLILFALLVLLVYTVCR
jgi:hypothetical protein